MVFVAPYAGAWIEISLRCRIIAKGDVAPYAGAWIEIVTNGVYPDKATSHPTRVRGLKFA